MNHKDALDAEIRAAQAAGDAGRLMEIYSELGRAEIAQDERAGAFLLVQALVYGLEAGRAEADNIHQILKALGREE